MLFVYRDPSKKIDHSKSTKEVVQEVPKVRSKSSNNLGQCKMSETHKQRPRSKSPHSKKEVYFTK